MYVSFKIKDTNDEMAVLARTQACAGELKAWMTQHLQLNDDKTEVLVITTLSSASKHSLTDVVIGGSILQPTAVARNIGVMFDSKLCMKSHMPKLCQVAYFHLHRIRSIRDCLTQHATELGDQFCQPCTTLRLPSDYLLTVRSAHLRHYGDRASCCSSPVELPHEMRKCDSLCIFKLLLKTF